MRPLDAWTPRSQCVHIGPEHDDKKGSHVVRCVVARGDASFLREARAEELACAGSRSPWSSPSPRPADCLLPLLRWLQALVKPTKEIDESCVGAVGYGMVFLFLRRQLVKPTKEIDGSCVGAVGYGIPVSQSTALVKLAKEIDESCVGAVGYGMVLLFLRRQRW